MEQEKKSFVFFSSWEKYLKTLELDRDIDYVNAVARAIIQYGIRGEIENEDPTILSRIEAVCSDLMQSNASRYDAAVQNGKRGGKPKQYSDDEIISMHELGLSEQDIADNLGCHIRTVKRALSNIEEEVTI